MLAAQGAAQAALLQDRLEEARTEYLRLTEMRPDDPVGYAGLGLVALRAGDHEEAERRLEEARERSPEDLDLAIAIARLRWEQGRLEEAREILRGVLDRDPAHPPALWSLAEIEREAGAPGSAARRELLEGILEADPGNLAARTALAQARLDAGLGEAAAAAMDGLRQQAPDFSAREREAFDRAEELALAGETEAAGEAFAVFRGDFEVTGAYQAGLETMRPPRGELSGIPRFLFPFMNGQLRVVEQEEVLASLRFVEASELAGLGDLQAPGAGAPGGDPAAAGPAAGAEVASDPAIPDVRAAVAPGDLDNDGDEDLLWVAGGVARFLRVDLGNFVASPEGLEPLDVGVVGAAGWVDLDDDRRLDVWLAGRPSRWLRNLPGGSFAEAVPVGRAEGGAARDVLFADLDQDGDLDVFEAREGPDRLYRNDGDGTFTESAAAFGVAGPPGADTRAAAFADLDDDLDLDLVLADGEDGLRVLSNLRSGRFEDVTEAAGVGETGDAFDVALGDVDGDGRIDIVVAGDGAIRVLLAREGGAFGADGGPASVLRTASEVRDLLLVDVDNDGYLDIVAAGAGSTAGTGSARGLRLFRNDGAGGFAPADGHLPESPVAASAVVSLDYNEDGDADLVVLGRDGRPALLRNDGGNANHYLKLELVGLGEGSRKNNRFGIGARVEVRAGDFHQVRTVTDPTVLVGLGGRLKADVIRVAWPNGVPQDLYFPGTDQDIVEQQTLKGSCPLLYTWNGERYEFVGDVMWKSALGMPLGILGGTGRQTYAPAFPSQEYRRLPDGVLAPRDGAYEMRLTEELWETIYVDEVALVAVDHPDAVEIRVDERFVPPAPTDLELWRVGESHRPVSARDGQGVDHLETLRARDFDYVAGFGPGRFQGLAEPHDLVLDLGPAARDGDVVLYLTGWVFPTDASINVAMRQGDAAAPVFPYLQVRDEDGAWTTAVEDIGIPSGKDKTVVVDLRGLFPSESREVRIRTNLQVYWDEAFFAAGPVRPAPGETRVTRLHPERADLRFRGFSREYRKGGRHGPHWFDYEDVSTEPRWADLEGMYTRYGDVRTLLVEGDDRYVIANAGDEIALGFDAEALPELPAGWTRTFLVYTDGWVKDGDLNTATGDRVEPLPFRGATRYPYPPDEAYPDTPEHRAYRETYNTRRVTSDRF